MNKLITFGNDGMELVETNFWDSDMAKEGFFYLSWNAGAARLLVPDSMQKHVAEMVGTKLVIVSRGFFGADEAIEILFEDESDSPYCLHFSVDQTDRMLPNSESGCGFTFTVWSRHGKLLTFDGKYRAVEKLPCLESWPTN